MLLHQCTPILFKGSIKDISIRPSDGIVSKAWEKAGLSARLEDFKDNIVVQMALPKQFRLTQQKYVIFDLKGNVVGRHSRAVFVAAGLVAGLARWLEEQWNI